MNTAIDNNSPYIKALRDYMGLKPEETLLVVSDNQKREIGLDLLEAGKSLCKEAMYIEMKEREINGQEPPQAIAELMKNVDVVVCPTNKSLTHTTARIEACKLGVRIGTMPGITKEILERCLSADYNEIIDVSNRVQKILDASNTIRVVTELGTDLTMKREGRRVISSTGVLREKGMGGNLPSGEVYLAPMEGTSNGKLVVDGSIAGIGMVDELVTIDIVDGYAVSITGGNDAKVLSETLSKVGKDAFSVAEFGFGTNYKAQIIGKILEDEKVLGTIHIAFGNNKGMGGNVDVPVHIDAIVKAPTVYFDDTKVMEKGKLLI